MNYVDSIEVFRSVTCERKINGQMIIPDDDQIVLDAMRKDGEEKRADVIDDMIKYLARNYNIEVDAKVVGKIFDKVVRKNIKNNKIAKGSNTGYYKVI